MRNSRNFRPVLFCKYCIFFPACCWNVAGIVAGATVQGAAAAAVGSSKSRSVRSKRRRIMNSSKMPRRVLRITLEQSLTSTDSAEIVSG